MAAGRRGGRELESSARPPDVGRCVPGDADHPAAHQGRRDHLFRRELHHHRSRHPGTCRRGRDHRHPGRRLRPVRRCGDLARQRHDHPVPRRRFRVLFRCCRAFGRRVHRGRARAGACGGRGDRCDQRLPDRFCRPVGNRRHARHDVHRARCGPAGDDSCRWRGAVGVQHVLHRRGHRRGVACAHRRARGRHRAVAGTAQFAARDRNLRDRQRREVGAGERHRREDDEVLDLHHRRRLLRRRRHVHDGPDRLRRPADRRQVPAQDIRGGGHRRDADRRWARRLRRHHLRCADAHDHPDDLPPSRHAHLVRAACRRRHPDPRRARPLAESGHARGRDRARLEARAQRPGPCIEPRGDV